MKLNMNMKRHSVPHVMLFPMESSFVNFKIFSFSGRKPWTIVHDVILGVQKKLGESDTVGKSISRGSEW